MGKFKAAKNDDYRPVPGLNEAARAPVSLWRLLAESRNETWLLIGASFALFASTIASLAVPALFGRVIDSLTPTTVTPSPPPEVASTALRLEIIALIAVSLANAAFSFLRGYLFAVAGERVVARLRQRVFASLMKQEVGFYDQTRVGELLSRLGGDTSLLKDAATSNISMALRWGATVVGGTAYLFFVSWRLTLVMLVIVPAVAVSARLYGKYVKALSKSVRQALAEATQVAEESMSAVRTVRAFANEPRQEAAYGEKVNATLVLGIRAALASGLFNGGTTGVTSLSFIAIVYYGGTLVLAGELSSGALTSFLLYALTIGTALGGLAGLFGSIMSAVGACDRVFQILDRVPIVPCSEGDSVPANLRGEIEFKDVSFAYPSRRDAKVLKHLSLHIPAGAVAALVGPSGGGKSTIIALIERWYDADDGAVLLDGRPLSALNGSALRKRIGIVQQVSDLAAQRVGHVCAAEELTHLVSSSVQIAYRSLQLFDSSCPHHNAHTLRRSQPSSQPPSRTTSASVDQTRRTKRWWRLLALRTRTTSSRRFRRDTMSWLASAACGCLAVRSSELLLRAACFLTPKLFCSTRQRPHLTQRVSTRSRKPWNALC